MCLESNMQSLERMVSYNGIAKQAFYTQMIDVCMMESSEADMKVIMKQLNTCVIKCDLKVNGKSYVVYINGEVGRRT